METLNVLINLCGMIQLLANALSYILFSNISTVLTTTFEVTNSFTSTTWMIGIPAVENPIINSVITWINDTLISFVELVGIADMTVVEGLLFLSAVFLFVGLMIRLISNLTPD